MRQVNDVIIPHTYGIYKYLNGEIISTISGNKIPEVDGKVHLPGTIYENAIDSSINRLWHAAIMPCNIPYMNLKSVVVKRVSNDGNPFEDLKSFYQIPHPLLRDLRYVPDHSTYAVNSDGKVILNTKTGEYLTAYKNADGYMMIRVTGDDGKSTIMPVHRLVAMTWLRYDADTCRLDVDHADGVRDNNFFLNLSLVTKKVNNDRANMHGNYGKKKVEVSIVDLDDITRTKITYESVAELCRVMKFGKPSIHVHLNKLEPNRTFKARWVIWYANTAVPDFNKCLENRFKGSQTRTIEATNVLTKEVKIFNQAKEVLSEFAGKVTKKQLEKTLLRNDHREFDGWYFQYFN